MQCVDVYPIKRKWPYVEFSTAECAYVLYLVSLYANGYIADKYINYCKKSRRLFVTLYDLNEINYDRDIEYFLVLEPSANTMEIKTAYNINKFIPTEYLKVLACNIYLDELRTLGIDIQEINNYYSHTTACEAKNSLLKFQRNHRTHDKQIEFYANKNEYNECEFDEYNECEFDEHEFDEYEFDEHEFDEYNEYEFDEHEFDEHEFDEYNEHEYNTDIS